MALSRLPSTVADEYQATIQAYVEKEYLRKVPYGVAICSVGERSKKPRPLTPWH